MSIINRITLTLLGTKQDKTSIATSSLIAGTNTTSQKIRTTDQGVSSDVDVDSIFSTTTLKDTNGKIILSNGNDIQTAKLTVINTIQPTPTATGNTTNLNSVFKDSNNDTWIVDKLGNAIKAGSTVKKTTKRVTQALVAGNNVITHNLDLVAPFFVEISVRNATTGALITATKVPNSETTNTVAVESLSENASAEINIIAI
jgi:hypothetical protein